MSQPASAASAKVRPRDWAPRIWEGCDLFAWLRLLARNRFAVHPQYLYIAGVVSTVSIGHTVLRWLQEARFGRHIRRTRIEHPPLFILGHWRAGTTLLHELLIQDPQHNCPNTYQCFVPNHFLLTEQLGKRYLKFLMPDRRPMDNMAAGWDLPQEDEFALCMLGQPSPYLDIAFPNRPSVDPGSLDLSGLSPGQLRSWKRTFYRFLQMLTYKDPRRLVLKSPPHSARIPILLEMFPKAKFIHIVRNPYVVYPSTINLWKSLYRKHGLQTPNFRGLEEKVFSTFTFLYEKLEAGKQLIPPRQFYELRYEDLIEDMPREMARLYEALDLPGFEAAEPQIEAYAQRTADYATNRYELSPAQIQEITRRWGEVIRRYDYPILPPTSAGERMPTTTRRKPVSV